MSVAEAIALKVSQLPPARQAEVLDFVEFLSARTTTTTEEELAFRSLALASLSDDDDPVVYSLEDCKVTR